VTVRARHCGKLSLRRAAFVFFVSAAWLAPTAGTAQSPLASSPSLPPHADIVLLGPDPATAAVKDVTTELLAREHVNVSWASQASFRPQDIFAPEADESGAVIAVWIDLSAETEARLYFRDARADRFFLRSVPLARGIDEMAKEEIAHIVANAVSALSKGLGETLTRTEARVALHMRRAPELRSTEAPSPRPWRWSAALLLGGQLFANELPRVANTSGLLALAHRFPGHWSNALGGWASLGYQFAADYQGSMVGATVQSTALRAGVLWTGELSRRLVLGFALGAGVDRIRYSSQAMREEVIVAPGGTFYVPAVSSWAGLDFRLVGELALIVHLSFDALLKQVHFDLHDSSGQESRVLEPYSLRPGAALGLAYTF
jgi:hypothetical protein